MEEKKVRRQDKWEKKAGVIAKTYKVNAETAEQYAKACNDAGVSMGGQLTEMMNEFIEKVKASE